MKLSKISAAILVAITSTPTFANQDTTILDEIFVSDSSIISDNIQTPYSTETYTRKAISQSGANSLSDFLSQNTSISIQPSYGNPLSPLLDMNGFGTESGYENIQVIVDGVSLNNIDGVPQQLSSVAVESIEQISILRGAGSVLYGNGATAGAIVITTNKGFSSPDNNSISSSYGSNQTTHQSISLKKSINVDGVQLLGALNAEALHSNGSKQINSDGTRNSLDNTNISGTFGIKKNESSAIVTIEKSDSLVNYAGHMSLADFNQDPNADQTSGNTEQKYSIDTKKLLLSTLLSSNTKIDYTLNYLDKNSTNKTSSISADYVQIEHKIDLKTVLDSMVIQYGIAKKQSTVKSESPYATTDKSRDESAIYALINYDYSDKILVSAGARKQVFNQDSNKNVNEDLRAYNLGINYILGNTSSLYANINHAFLAPNLDRLFDYMGVFSADIEPQESDTYTLGYKLKGAEVSAKAEIFYIDLNNEIYVDSDWNNLNFDKSHKQGVNISLNRSMKNIKTGIRYNYVHAVIDKKIGQNYSGSMLPGVAEHTVNLFAQYDFRSSLFDSLPTHSIKINHKQSSDSFMMSDFSNEGSKAPGYKSTDISYRLANKKVALQLGVNNILNESNGLYVTDWAGDVRVYPTNYDRYYYFTANYQF